MSGEDQRRTFPTYAEFKVEGIDAEDLERRDRLFATEKPITRGDCKDGPRPCPWVSCRHHTYLEVKDNGSIFLNHPGKEVHELKQSCSLDVADDGRNELIKVGEALGMAKARAQQIEAHAAVRARNLMLEWAPDSWVPGTPYAGAGYKESTSEASERAARLYAQRRRDGICIKCKSEAADFESTFCESCKLESRIRERKRSKRYLEASDEEREVLLGVDKLQRRPRGDVSSKGVQPGRVESVEGDKPLVNGKSSSGGETDGTLDEDWDEFDGE